jgi:hypothetical protein
MVTTTPIEVTTAIIAGAAVIAGTVSGGIVGLLTERWRAETDSVRRAADRRAALDDLQRTTLLEIQDATLNWLGTFSKFARDMTLAEANKPWGLGMVELETQREEVTARAQVLKLVERARDDGLRARLMAFTSAGVDAAIGAQSYPDFRSRYQSFLNLWPAASKALGVEIRKLLM